ncbi:unnamed protein product [Allacma fusca]|uniref:Speckle-type POZ protein n=1 Tax=Allacma fusca TaxID=39272 RepID=A0A8J2JZ90_9HEXA|nr:unnamed protein product [Allacma fusca]
MEMTFAKQSIAIAHYPVMGNVLSLSPENVDCWISTEIETERFSFLWTIKNFSTFPTVKEIRSPPFKRRNKCAHKWRLKVIPRHKVGDKEYLSVFLILVSDGDAGKEVPSQKNRKLGIKTRFQISLIDADGRIFKQAGGPMMSGNEFSAESPSWGYYRLILAADLLTPLRRVLDGDCLRIHCCIWVDGVLKHTSGLGGAEKDMSPDEISLRHLKSLSEDMESAFNSPTFADVTLTTNDANFFLHKTVLAARSRVFKAMFSHTMVESTVNIVKITDFEEETVKSMLEYIYSGRTSVECEKAPDLLRISEKYELIALKEECERVIASNLTIENAAEVLVLAHFHNAVKLKAKAIEFIKRNKEKLRSSDAFIQMAQAHGGVFLELYMSQ